MKLRAATPLILSLALAVASLAHACSSGVSPGDSPIDHSRAGLGCYADSQCGLDHCNTALFPGGACVGTCDDAGACPDEPDGGPGPQVCLGAPNTGGCLRTCEKNGGCIRDGWICQDGPSGGRVCLPDCRSDAVLCTNADLECSTFDGVCRIPLSNDAGLFGRCDGFHTCESPGSCLALTGERGDGGYCTIACTPATAAGTDGGASADTCPSGGACVVLASLSDGGSEHRCGVPCNAPDAGPCAPGLTCQELAGGSIPDGGTIWISLCAP